MRFVVFDTSALIILLKSRDKVIRDEAMIQANTAWSIARMAQESVLVGMVKLELLGGLTHYPNAHELDALIAQFDHYLPGQAPQDEAVAEAVLRAVNDARSGGRPRGLTGADALIYAAAVRLAESDDGTGRKNTVEIVTQDAGFSRAHDFHPRVAVVMLPG